MNDFFQYVAAMWQLFIQDLGRFLKLTFVDPWSEVGQNFRDYNDILNLYKPGFGAGGWILFVLYYLIIAALIGGRSRGRSAGGFGGFGGFGGNAGADFGAGGCNGGCGGNARQSTGEMNMNVNIDMYTALLGGEGIVKLSNGSKIKLKIKPETQNGTKVRVRGKGYDRGDGTFGDLIITYNVKLPTGLTERQKELLKEMKEAK